MAGTLVAVATEVVRAQPSQPAPPSTQAKPPLPTAKRFCWQGRPLARCRSFILMELATHSHWFGSKLNPVVTRPLYGTSRDDDALASHIVAELGAMVNTGPRSAVGGTLTTGAIKVGGKPVTMYGVTMRYRRWLTPSVSADAGGGLFKMPVGAVVQLQRENVLRPAVAADVRLGFRDLLSVTGRLMVADDGDGRRHHAFFVGAATGSKLTAIVAGTFTAAVLIFSPRGDKVTVQ